MIPPMAPDSVDHYVVQNRLTKKYIRGNGNTDAPYCTTSDIDRAEPCTSTDDADVIIRGYIRWYRREGHPVVPSRNVFIVVPVPKKPPPRTLWERLA